MNRELSRRRLLASTGLLASGAAAALAAGSPRDGAGSVQESAAVWSETYGDDPVTLARAVTEGEGEYVALGSTGTLESQRGWLFGVDADSRTGEWSTTLSNDDLETQPIFLDAASAPDDGYVLLGVPRTTDPTSLVKTSATGEVEWWEAFEAEASGEEEEEDAFFGQALAPTDGGYVVGGFRIAGQDYTAVALTVDGDGNEVGRTRYFEEDISTILGLEPLGDGFVAAGERQPDGGGDSPLRGNLFRVGADRSIQWQSDFGGEFDGENQVSQFRDVVALDDGYVAVGNVITADQVFKGWVVGTDGSGDGRENRTVAPQTVTSLASATRADDGAVVAGEVAESVDSQTSAAWIAEFDASTGIRWQETRTESDVNRFQDVVATGDGGVVAAGDAQRNSQDADVLGRAWLTAYDVPESGTPGTDPGGEATATPMDSPTPTPTTGDGSGETPTPTGAAGATPTAAAGATPTPTPGETTDQDETAETTEATEDGGAVTPAPDDTTTSDGGPGFGVGTALAAVGAGTALSRFGYLDGDE